MSYYSINTNEIKWLLRFVNTQNSQPIWRIWEDNPHDAYLFNSLFFALLVVGGVFKFQFYLFFLDSFSVFIFFVHFFLFKFHFIFLLSFFFFFFLLSVKWKKARKKWRVVTWGIKMVERRFERSELICLLIFCPILLVKRTWKILKFVFFGLFRILSKEDTNWLIPIF